MTFLSLCLVASSLFKCQSLTSTKLEFSLTRQMFPFLSRSRYFYEVSPMGTTDDSANYRILVTFGLIFSFFFLSFNFCIHLEEVNRIIFFFLAESNRNWIKVLDLSHSDDYL